MLNCFIHLHYFTLFQICPDTFVLFFLCILKRNDCLFLNFPPDDVDEKRGEKKIMEGGICLVILPLIKILKFDWLRQILYAAILCFLRALSI